MEINKLNEILKNHKLWLNGEGGECANLRGADLRYANLYNIDLRCANLNSADLNSADLRCANLRGVDLSGANLNSANLSGASLYNANLSGASLYNANLYSSNLNNANLNNVKTNMYTIGYNLACPEEGSFIGYKKVGKYIVKLLIMEDSKRNSATTLKCRCDKAKVLDIENIETGDKVKEIRSSYDSNFIYKVGEIVSVDNFDNNRWNECSTGIHFFVNKENAINY